MASNLNPNPAGQLQSPAPQAQMVESPDLEDQSFTRRSEASSEDSKESSAQPVEADPQGFELKRELPSTEISQESVDENYVQFIFFCNPNIPLSIDTTELRRGFRSPPKTDGKVFDTFALFGLIKRLEAKEIETWAQLVIELGVEPPDPTKNQSAQKVQQFAVRLKRWLHAFHIDAFFQYCLGKFNVYFTQIPDAGQPLSELARDGVPSEEDLALRALLPEWRPKRGRRKIDHADDTNYSSVKRTQRASSANLEASQPLSQVYSARPQAHPQSAFPWSQDSGHLDPWTAAQRAVNSGTYGSNAEFTAGQTPIVASGQQAFWGESQNTMAHPYPQSAITPSISQVAFGAEDIPQSAHPQTAITPYQGKKPRKQAVSAAWSNSSGASGKKLRGRPPSDRSVQDGPYSTFPANPTSKQSSPRIHPTTSTPQSNAIDSTPESSRLNHHIPGPFPPTGLGTPLTRKPSKLQLQVPQHEGGPVRLATPPPKVLVNGEDNNPDVTRFSNHMRRSSADFFNTLDEDVETIELDGNDDSSGIDWKRRALALKRKLDEKEKELRALRRRVLDAVM